MCTIPLRNDNTNSAPCGMKLFEKQGYKDLEAFPPEFSPGFVVLSPLYIWSLMWHPSKSVPPSWIGQPGICFATTLVIAWALLLHTFPPALPLPSLLPSSQLNTIPSQSLGYLLCNVPHHHSDSAMHSPAPTFLPSLCPPGLLILPTPHLAPH